MSPNGYSCLLIIGFLSLFHSAFSAVQHRSYLRITSLEFSSLPSDITVQAVVSMVLILCGVLGISGQFKEIRAHVELGEKTWETQLNSTSLASFNHRGRALSPSYILFENSN